MITYDELVEKLETGKSYKYKELCELLNEELTAGGKQRILQLNEWGRFFDFRSVGRALYLVKGIYECPKIKVTNSKYGDMDNILLSLLEEQNIGLVSIVDILKKLMIVNDRYSTVIFNTNSKKGITESVAKKINQTVVQTVERSLVRLRKEQYIHYTVHYKLIGKAEDTTEKLLTTEESQQIEFLRDRVIELFKSTRGRTLKVNDPSLQKIMNDYITVSYCFDTQYMYKVYDILLWKSCDHERGNILDIKKRMLDEICEFVNKKCTNSNSKKEAKELIEKALKIPEEYNLERKLNLSF